MFTAFLVGRAFAASDAAKSPEVIVVNQTMAAKYWPNQNPVGKTLRVENGNRQATVVGVVADIKYSDIDEAPQPFHVLQPDPKLSVGHVSAGTRAG